VLRTPLVPYRVRSAVTSRAPRTIIFEPASRRQEASMLGQVCCEQEFFPKIVVSLLPWRFRGQSCVSTPAFASWRSSRATAAGIDLRPSMATDECLFGWSLWIIHAQPAVESNESFVEKAGLPR
jgi:hypothetical protein